MKPVSFPAAATAAAVLLLAGCGGSGHAPAAGTANAQVCARYLAQRAWIKGLTQPALADVERFITEVTADAAQSTGRLHADLQAMTDGISAGRNVSAASGRVYDDCIKP